MIYFICGKERSSDTQRNGAAEDMAGHNRVSIKALPHKWLLEVMKKYNRLEIASRVDEAIRIWVRQISSEQLPLT